MVYEINADLIVDFLYRQVSLNYSVVSKLHGHRVTTCWFLFEKTENNSFHEDF